VALASGARLRPYEVTALLGAGGMGQVPTLDIILNWGRRNER
jgi:hypothetical protein